MQIHGKPFRHHLVACVHVYVDDIYARPFYWNFCIIIVEISLKYCDSHELSIQNTHRSSLIHLAIQSFDYVHNIHADIQTD